MHKTTSFCSYGAFLILAAIGLSGCQTTKYAELSIRDTDFPEVGVVVTADVGDRLIEQSYELQYDGAIVQEDSSCLNLLGAGPVFKTGQTFRKGTQGANTVFCGPITIKTAYGGLWQSEGCLQKNADEWKVNGAACSGLRISESKITETNAENFQRTLFYKGKSGNQVFLDYREFKNNLAREAFTQELIFDLEQGNEIGFRGMRMRILSASNTGIEYVIEKKFED